jgi:hypothetical protein
MLLLGALATLSMLTGGRGRQVRRFGRVLLPRLRPRDDWSYAARGAPRVAVDPAQRDRVAAAWRANAKTEHASVAAFARLTLDLMALGAPPELLVASQNDALDEIRHARLCLALATSIDGEHESPAPFPQVRHTPFVTGGRVVALSTLAVSSLVDGVLHEGLSARVIARLARLAEEPEIRLVLLQLAADEGRHAAHAWRVVEWCVREGGDPVIHALQGSARALPNERRAAPFREAADGSWERWGLPGAALDADEYLAARAHLARRVAELRGSRMPTRARGAWAA